MNSVRPTLSGSLSITRLAPVKSSYARSVRINSQENWIDEIAMLLGGYAAERIFLAAQGGASLGAGEDVKRCREIATEMVASGLSATTNPASRPFVGVHQGQIDEILDVAYSRTEAILRTIPRQEMFSAANELLSLGFSSGDGLQSLLLNLLRTAESRPALARQG